MNTNLLRLLIFFALPFVLPETIYREFHLEKVSNNQEIMWTKPSNLQGDYFAYMEIFPENIYEKKAIAFCIYKDNRQIKKYFADLEKYHNLNRYAINKTITINSGENIKILYNGNKVFQLRDRPTSSIMLTEINRNNQSKTTRNIDQSSSSKSNHQDNSAITKTPKIYVVITLLICAKYFSQ